MTTIVKSTTKGQITIPAGWRKQFKTDMYIIEAKADSLEVRPIDLDMIVKDKYYTLFNARQDNKGQGIDAKDLLKALKKSLKSDGQDSKGIKKTKEKG